MADLAFPQPATFTLPIVGQTSVFPVGRIFCVGRNYVAHAEEMGNVVDRAAPFYFTKSALNAVRSGSSVPFPQGTDDFHHEVELVVALGASLVNADPDHAMKAVFGYGCGLDMTRRDLQIRERKKQRPWDLGKDLENGSVLGPITPQYTWDGPASQAIWLDVNGIRRQTGQLGDMVWSVGELLANLSTFYHLEPGDIVMTGTPAGVGPVVPGDTIDAGITGLEQISHHLME